MRGVGLIWFGLLLAGAAGAEAAVPDGEARTAAVDGVELHYLTAGRGPVVILLHGYAETSRMWQPILPVLAKQFRVIAPDLPGIGDSSIPAGGMDMKTAAVRIHALARSLGVEKAEVVGHDIGLMVAYAYAAQFPAEVTRLVVMDAFLPGVGQWETIYDDPGFWHFRFHGPTPEALVQGRERIYFEHFWNDFAADKNRSLPEADRRAYTAAYARPGRMRAGWAYFASFPQTAKDFARLSQSKLTMPVLAIGGAKALGDALAQQMKLVATDVSVVVLKDTGHWVLEERPKETTDALLQFLSPAPRLGETRLTPAEIRAGSADTSQIGSSGVAGVHTRVLSGNPAGGGFYSILLFVPAHTTIQAHTHRDDRMATVVSGEWHLGYGNRFDARSLKTLPPGSVYSEPGGVAHFARTDAEPVVVQISGYGPTDTQYQAAQ